MLKPLPLLLTAALILSSCGTVRESRLNPFNWFGSSSSRTVQTQGEVNTLIPARRTVSIFRQSKEEAAYSGLLMPLVTDLVIERRPGGALIRATGASNTIGVFDARLIRVTSETPGTLIYELRAIPGTAPAAGAEYARSVTVAVVLTDQQLDGIRQIVVRGQSNERVSRR